MKARIHTLISQMSQQMYEREQVIAQTLLAAVAGSHTFLYGLPGTAKSLISRRVAAAFEVDAYFEYLMNRFSTPEEIFGPVSIKALKEDHYIRKTEHYLPCADFAFLDEIWKASPAILNTLLTLVNEKVFKNGEQLQQVPLSVLIGASNEIPEPNQGLDALYDRFILRLVVEPIQQAGNFHQLLQAKPGSAHLQLDESLKITQAELAEWREQIHEIELPALVLQVIDLIRQYLQQHVDGLSVYISDRRWQRVAYLLKAAAFLNGRSQVLVSDLYLLKSCLWNQLEDIPEMHKLIDQAILEIGLHADLQLESLIQRKDELEQQMLNAFYYTDDVYESYLIQDKEYLRAVTHLDHHYQDKVLYLLLNKMDSKQDFFAVDASGEEIRGIVCNFNGGRVCTLKGGYYGLEEVVTPYIKYPKGSARRVIDEKLVQQLRGELAQLQNALSKDLALLKQRFNAQSAHFASVFVAAADSAQLQQHVQQQLQRYQLQLQDCARLEQLCQG